MESVDQSARGTSYSGNHLLLDMLGASPERLERLKRRLKRTETILRVAPLFVCLIILGVMLNLLWQAWLGGDWSIFWSLLLPLVLYPLIFVRGYVAIEPFVSAATQAALLRPAVAAGDERIAPFADQPKRMDDAGQSGSAVQLRSLKRPGVSTGWIAVSGVPSSCS